MRKAGRATKAGLILLAALLAVTSASRLHAWDSESRDSGPRPASRAHAWRFVTGGRAAYKPASDHRGVLYVASADRYLYALSHDGSERWRAALGSRPSGSPVVSYDGTILVPTASGTLMAFAPTGRERWRFRSPDGPCLTPALGVDGSVYLPAQGGTLHSLAYDGRERWRFRSGSQLDSPPAVGADGNLYLGTSDRRLLCLAPSGERRWELALPGEVSTPAVGADGFLYVGAAGVHRVSPEGSPVWSFPIPARTAAPVLTVDGAIVAGAWNGRLYALSPEGTRLWEVRLPAPIAESPAAAGDVLYVATASPRLYAVSVEGAVRWSFAAKQSVGIPALARDGGLYLGAEDWIFYSLGVPAVRPPVSGWPVYLHDHQNTGRAGALQDLDNAAALLLKALAFSDSPELKLMALVDIQRYLRGERYLGVHVQILEEILGFLASEGVTIRRRESGALVGSHPEVRAATCRVLAELGTEGARLQLLSVLGNDDDLASRVAAMQALGVLGLDPDGRLARLVSSIPPRGGEEILLAAGAEALGRIALSPRGAVHPDCLRALARLGLREYPPVVRRRAAGFVEELQRQRR